MPQGLPAIGALVVGAFSTTAAAGMSAITLGVIGAVASAAVGAAIGGLTAAITGGDIGKGMLFGAIGGVVTGGLAGASIANSFGGVATQISHSGFTEAAMMSGAQISSTGVVQGVSTTAAGTLQGAAAGGAGGIMGSIGKLGEISSGAGMLGKAAIDAMTAGLTPDPETPYSQTKEYFEDAQQHDKDMAKLSANLRSSSGGSQLPWSTSEAGVKYQRGMEYKMNSENNIARMTELNQTYKLKKEETTHQFDLQQSVFDDAATAASSGEYKSGRATVGQQITESQKPKAALAGATV